MDKKTIDLLIKELNEIESKKYEISDVSDLMKKVVIEHFGDEDWSTSGYWVRAKELVNLARILRY